VRGSYRLRRLERQARRKRAIAENAQTNMAHDWMWRMKRWDLFDPMLEAAEECLDALESEDEEAMSAAAERFHLTEAELMKAYNASREEQNGHT
jgi:hypothetical protein